MARYDLALIVLDGPGPESSSLYSGTIEIGDEVLLVGYGFAIWPTTTGFGTKRWGSNTVRNIENGVIEISGEATDESNSSGIDSTGTVGDSGGPLFKDNKIVGVTSWGGISEFEFGNSLNHMHYVDLTTIESRAFLRESIEAAQEIDKKIDNEF